MIVTRGVQELLVKAAGAVGSLEIQADHAAQEGNLAVAEYRRELAEGLKAAIVKVHLEMGMSPERATWGNA